MEMTPEKEMRRVTLSIGAAFIANLLLLMLLLSLPSLITDILTDGGAFALTDGEYAAVSTVESALYMLSFIIPVLLFRLITPGRFREPMRLRPAGGFDSVLLIFAGIGTVFAAATLNSWFVSFIDFSPLYGEDEALTPVGIVCAFVGTALVPAVCEEFLYRGCILSNLLPYGRTTAIVGSALLFALMHGNFQQYLYTFCAGLVLGLAYTESGSIFPPLCIHLVNNFISVIEEKIYYSSSFSSDTVLIIFESAVFAAGLAALAWYVFRNGGRLGRGKESAGGIPDPALPVRRSFLSPAAKRVKLFFSPTVIVGACLSLTEAIALVLMAISYS
ncbi:MAG: CPBP family intramembrane metalloprotease [Clostridiales bacterium]|nr:CPBP family intramembrane metalloprotease [Clostridiales bacterium]